MEAFIVPSGNPQWHFAPRFYVVSEQERFGNPGKARSAAAHVLARVQHFVHGQGIVGAGCVVDAGAPLLDHADRPFGQVAHVDDLYGHVGLAGCQRFAATRDAHRPIRKTVGRVVRAYDQTGADVQCALYVQPRNRSLAQRLERPVRLAADLLDRFVGKRAYRVGLVGIGNFEIAVNGDAGYERVVLNAITQRLCRRAHDARHVPAGVDHGIPAAALERCQAAADCRVAVATHFLQLRK